MIQVQWSRYNRQLVKSVCSAQVRVFKRRARPAAANEILKKKCFLSFETQIALLYSLQQKSTYALLIHRNTE